MTTAENPMRKIITRCWEDEEFKKRLMVDPAKILAAEGVNVPDGVSIRVVEDTDQVRTLIIPPAPSHLDDDQLKGITGGLGRCPPDWPIRNPRDCFTPEIP
jgi:Nitrile hydratase, alpha chain